MRRILFSALLLLPAVALAEQPCAFQAPRNLDLDLAGVRTVQFDVHSHNLHVKATPAARRLSLRGRACSSDQGELERLTVEQHRDGDRLVVELGGKSHMTFSIGRSSYNYLDVDVALPANLPVEVNVGSGDADVHGVASLESSVGSGDLNIYDVAGKISSRVGSGDIEAERVGGVDIDTIGSGDFKGSEVRGDVKIGSIGSGDAELRKVKGNIEVDTIGSGSLNVDGATGDLTVHTKGSGDVDHRDVAGKVNVPTRD
jgi:DUF4097 and DUF4098 domain-containing protein YvlB